MAEVGVPVALDVQLAVLPGEPVGRGQLVGALEERLVQGAVLEGQVGAQRLGVDLPAEAGVLQQALDLGAEHQFARIRPGVVEGFDAEHVPCTVQGVGPGIVHHKGEHAPQHGGQPGAVFLVPVQDHLGVAVGLEDVAFGLQFGAQVHKVVDLAVEHADHAAVLVVHGLAARRQINDAQPAEAQRHRGGGGVAAQVVALHIRPAVDDAVRHLVQDRFTPGAQAGKTNKTTHACIPFPFARFSLFQPGENSIRFTIIPQGEGKRKPPPAFFGRRGRSQHVFLVQEPGGHAADHQRQPQYDSEPGLTAGERHALGRYVHAI